jgi:hypothetical protein
MAEFGSSGLIKDPGAVYKVAQDSFATYDKSYSGVLVGAVPFLQGDVAEEYPNVVLLTMEISETGIACGHVQIKLHYEGKATAFIGSDTIQDISVDVTTSQEPIETHPDFTTDIGGTPETPLHGAYFDATTFEFLGFPVVDPSEQESLPSRFAGLRSYLMPQQTFTSNTVELSYPTSDEIGNVGKVFDPGINLPELPGERNWLNTGIRVQNIANVYFRTQKTGMLSGPRKWIPEVYGA